MSSELREVVHFKGNSPRFAVVTGIKCCASNEEHTVYKFILSPDSKGLHVRLLQTAT